MNCLKLEPLDVWTVRDGRPFDVGGTVHARALWPPSPWTILGAIRTALCGASGIAAVDYGDENTADERVKKAVEVLGPANGRPTFSLAPALLTQDSDIIWPVPLDCVTFTEDKDDGAIHCVRLRALRRTDLGGSGYSSSGASRAIALLPPYFSEDGKHPDKALDLKWFSAAQLGAWLAGRPIPKVSKKNHCLPLKSEPRIGIKIDPRTGTVEEGRFYVRHAYALKAKCSLTVPVTEAGRPGIPWAALDGQHVRLGADGHLASLTWREGVSIWPASGAAGKDGTAALLFLSPVHPDDFAAISVNGSRVSCEAIAGGKAIAIGGWQLRHDGKTQVGPRRMRRYYPAGTVAYVRAEADLSPLHATSIARDPEEKAAGFGFCLVGMAPAAEQ